MNCHLTESMFFMLDALFYNIVVRFWFVLAQKLPPNQNKRFGKNGALKDA